MNRRTTLALSTTALLCLGIALPGAALAQQKSLREQLTGTWTIVSNDNVARTAPSGSFLVPIRKASSYSPPMGNTLKSSCVLMFPNSKSTTGWRGKQGGGARNRRYVWHLVGR